MPTIEELDKLNEEQLDRYFFMVNNYDLDEAEKEELYGLVGGVSAPTEPAEVVEEEVEVEAPRGPYIQPARTESYSQVYGDVPETLTEQTTREGGGVEGRARAKETVDETLNRPISAAGFQATPVFGAGGEGFFDALKAQPIHGELSTVLTATRGQAGQEVTAQLRAQAIRNLAKSRGADEENIEELRQEMAKINQEVATREDTADLLEQMTSQLEERHIQQYQQDVFNEAYDRQLREGNTGADGEKAAIAEGNQETIEYIKETFPDRYREMLGYARKPEDVQLGLLSEITGGRIGTRIVGREGVYESPGAATLRAAGGLLSLPMRAAIYEPLIMSTTYEVDEFGEPLDKSDFNYQMHLKSQEAFDKAARGEADAIDLLKGYASGMLAGTARRTAAAGAELPVNTQSYTARLNSAMATGRFLGEDFVQLAVPKMDAMLKDKLGWETETTERAYWLLGLGTELAAPILPTTAVGKSMGAFGTRLAQMQSLPAAVASGTRLATAGEAISAPLQALAVPARTARREALAEELGVDVANVPATTAEVMGKAVGERVFEGIEAEFKAKKAVTGDQRAKVLNENIRAKQLAARNPELQRSLGAIADQVEAVLAKEGSNFLAASKEAEAVINAKRLQDMVEENITQAIMRAAPNDVHLMPTIDLMVTTPLYKKHGKDVDNLLSNYKLEDLVEGSVRINLRDPLYRAAMKDEFYRPIVNKVAKGERLDVTEAAMFRSYLRREAWKEYGAVKALTKEAPTLLGRDRMLTTGTRRALTTPRAIQDIALGALAKGNKRASQWVAERTMPTVGMTGTQQQIITEMNKALNTAATRYNQALMGQMQLLKGEGLKGKDLRVSAFLNNLNEFHKAPEARLEFYDNFLKTFFGGAQRSVDDLGSMLGADDLKEFLSRPISIDKIQAVVETGRASSPFFTKKGMRSFGGFGSDALVEASQIATLQKISNDAQAEIVERLVQQNPQLFIDFKGRSLPSAQQFKASTYESLFQGEWLYKYVDQVIGAYKVPKDTSDIGLQIYKAEQLGVPVDETISYILNEMIKYTGARFRRQTAQSTLNTVVQAALKGKGSDAKAINTELAEQIWFRGGVDEGKEYAKFHNMWNTFDEFTPLAQHPAYARFVDLKNERGVPRTEIAKQDPPTPEAVFKLQGKKGATLDQLKKIAEVGHRRLWNY